MAKSARFDCVAPISQAATKNFFASPSLKFTITFEVYLSTAYLAANGNNSTAVFEGPDVVGDGPQVISGQWFTWFTGVGPITDVRPDTWIPVELVYTHVAGATWGLVVTIDGVSSASIPETFLSPPPTNIGLNFGATANPETGATFMRNVVIKDDANVIIFSDDFASGAFDPGWDGVTAGCSVVSPMLAQFDAQIADAFLSANLPPSGGTCKIDFELYFPSWAPNLGDDFDPNVLEVGTGPIDAIFPWHNSGVVGYSVDTNVTPSGAPIILDAFFVLEALLTNTGGTLWDVQWSINGVVIWTDVGIDFSIDGTAVMPSNFGAKATGHALDYLLFIRSVTVVDGSAVTLFETDFSFGDDFPEFDAVTGDVTRITAIPPPPPKPVPPSRFFEGYPWRFVFTDLHTVTTTWAEGLLTNRRIALILDDASVIEADVWPDDFRVNGIWTDGYPRLAQSNRLVYCLRRDNPSLAGGLPPWTCRAAGILMSPQDQGSPDVPLTHFAAYDSWRYLDARPCMDDSGNLPSSANGFQFFDTGDQVILQLLKNTIDAEGTVHVDAGVAWSGTPFYAGTLETTPAVNFTVQRGDSVGTAWRNMVGIGNCDIILTPIYDPINRPGYTHELSIYNLAGANRRDAVFGWDRMNHALTNIDRMHDGTPGMFFNKVQYFSGFGGFPIPAGGPLVNAASVAAYGSWWSQQFFPGQTDTDPTGAAVLALAAQALELAKQGKRTVTLSPTPERAPIPLVKYGLGDRIPVYASARLRVTIDGLQRVQSIPFAIADDGIETVAGLVVSPDWRGAP